MKIILSPLKIEDIQIQEFSYKFKSDSKVKTVNYKKLNFDFEIKKAPDKNEFVVFFKLENSNVKSALDFSVKGMLKYLLPKKLNDEKISRYIYGNMIPQIYSNLRGYLYAVSQNMPLRIVLPVINLAEMYEKERKEYDKERNRET